MGWRDNVTPLDEPKGSSSWRDRVTPASTGQDYARGADFGAPRPTTDDDIDQYTPEQIAEASRNIGRAKK